MTDAGPQDRAPEASTAPVKHHAHKRRLRRNTNAFLVASVSAFVGGMMVVGFQIGFATINARYPALVQGMHCDFPTPDRPNHDEEDADDSTDIGGAGMLMPLVPAGTSVTCRLDAPGADYVAWTMAGGRLAFRSGPLDQALPCQDEAAFASQAPDHLAVSACQSFLLKDIGVHRLTAKVVARGQQGLDRADVYVRAVHLPPPDEPPGAVQLQLQGALVLPASTQNIERKVQVQESLNEHGLLPTSRDFTRTVYKLAEGETYVSSNFLARSAENATAMRVYYVQRTRSIAMSFTLRSGPFVDRWRGWLSGTVVVTVKREEPGRDLALPPIELTVPGRLELPLPEGADGRGDGVVRLALPGDDPVAIPLGGSAPIGPALVSVRINDKTIVIQAEATKP